MVKMDSLEKTIRSKARRPRQEVGIYDPMEQAGHSDMVSVSYVLKELGVVAQKIREIQSPYKTYDNRRRYSPRYIIGLLDKVLGLLVEPSKQQDDYQECEKEDPTEESEK